MKTRSRRVRRRFELRILGYGNGYYIDSVRRLETALASRPSTLQIDLIGEGEIPADTALLFRSVLLTRSPDTTIITNARSSLQNGSVLIWLLGDQRRIREDARVFFRHAQLPENEPSETDTTYPESEQEYRDSFSGIDPEEGDHARVLECIDEFLPVRELTGRLIAVPLLRQFGLVDNEAVDHFLAAALGGKPETRDRRSARTPNDAVGRDSNHR